jgi:polyphosphate kinase 2 (PPK2 family)
MFEALESEYLVPCDGSFRVSKASTSPATDRHRHKGKHRKRATDALRQLQRVLAAGDRHAVLLVFQAMDAAGKDSTIRAVMRGVDPSGCQVFSFKKPSSLELDHDFLWRTACCLPERGRIVAALPGAEQGGARLFRCRATGPGRRQMSPS